MCLTYGQTVGGIVRHPEMFVMVRFADDMVLGFQYKHEAMRFQEELRRRFTKFNLEVHTEKTSLIEFGRYAVERRKERGDSKPEPLIF